MNTQETTTGNRRETSKRYREIVEVFMGYTDGYLPETISWNDVMPVVEKIEQFWNPLSEICMLDEHEYSRFSITDEGVELFIAGFRNAKRTEFEFVENHKTSGSKINSVWQACVQFIQWYNQNKTT